MLSVSFSTLLAILIGLLSCPNLVSSYAYTYARFDDVLITINNTHWQCDQIFCPKKTYRCHVGKENDPNDGGIVVRENTCYDRMGNVLSTHTRRDALRPVRRVSLNADSYANGVTTVGSHFVQQDGGQIFQSNAGNNYAIVGHDVLPPSFYAQMNELSNLGRNIQNSVQEQLRSVNAMMPNINRYFNLF